MVTVKGVEFGDSLDWYIDLDRYPIHLLDSAEGAALLANARRMMRRDTLVVLPDFLRGEAVLALQEELSSLESRAYRVNYDSTAYGWMNNTGFAVGHPRSALFPRRCGVITTDRLSEHGPSWSLYRFQALTDFVRQMLGVSALYRSACPTLAVQVNTMTEGESFGWHFDTNDGVVSFTIQNADQGGGFEYAPLIRDEQDEHYDDVARIFSGQAKPERPQMEPGTLSLFLGRRSLHRVAPVGPTTRSRISLLYSYDQQPGMVFPVKTCERLRSGSTEPYLGALTEVG